jgi:N-acetylmuramoyl-L-alanine amidase
VTERRHQITQAAIALTLLAATSLSPAQTPTSSQPTPSAQTPAPSTPAPQTPSQPKTPPAFYRNLIFLDPAHGATDPGADLPGNADEKAVTLAFATRLRLLLTNAGFTVISSRETDPAAPITTDQRADIANHARPTACIILHATTSGSGIHIATSALAPLDPTHPHFPLPWGTAQSASIPQSLRLANQIGVALLNARYPVLLIHASIPPLDNLTCPAIALELAPLTSNDKPTPVTDATYQQKAAEAITTALTAWRTRLTPTPATSSTPATTPGATR